MSINVLSLFDGCSGGRQALERTGIKVNQYYASEIDKYAIKVTQANYPNTIQLGSVVDVDVSKLPKIDLLLGGSPCQSFSFAGKRKGMSTKCETEILTLNQYLELKKEGFEFEGQSYLFWEYMRILTEIRQVNPDVKFLLENVEMGEKWEKVLSKAIGVNGVHINSALVSAQNRKRIYWCNFGIKSVDLFNEVSYTIPQPEDKGVLLKDILQNEVDEKYFLSEKMIEGFKRHKERHNNKGTGFAYSPKNENHKGNALRANAALCPTDNMVIVHNTMPRSSTTGKGGTGHLSRNDGKTYCLDTGNTNAIEINVFDGYNNRMRTDEKCGSITQHCSREGMTNGFKVVVPSNAMKIFNNKRLNETLSNNDLVENCLIDSYNKSIHLDKSVTVSTRVNASSCTHVFKNKRIRRLTPIECERLQTVKDNYTNHVSDSQRYKMLGNGWTIDVICHILQFLSR